MMHPWMNALLITFGTVPIFPDKMVKESEYHLLREKFVDARWRRVILQIWA
jgi:hypothetical protein